MHTPAPDGSYTGMNNNSFLLNFAVLLVFILISCLLMFGHSGVNNHLYTIFDPRNDGEETWDNWNLICRVNNLHFLLNIN